MVQRIAVPVIRGMASSTVLMLPRDAAVWVKGWRLTAASRSVLKIDPQRTGQVSLSQRVQSAIRLSTEVHNGVGSSISEPIT